jgi:ribonucleoside-triphosphate reductase (thioredoxin)
MPVKMSPYQSFIAISRYSRWLEEEQRRESWEESVDRYMDFMTEHLKKNFEYEPTDDSMGTGIQSVRTYFQNLKALGSMRALMTAGPALERSHIAGYNCSYLPVDDPIAFDEILYILMNGTGVGFSVEKKYVDQLPTIEATWYSGDHGTIVVEDSKEGWAKALRELVTALYSGFYPEWDTSAVRPAGSRLATFGGRSSGPEPLEDLFGFICDIFSKAQGRKLTTLEVFDIVCKIASVVVVGGVRRSALIGLTDLDDESLATAKSGEWWKDNGHRALCNISAVYEGRPTQSRFMEEWRTIYDSKSGERGIFNREASRNQAAKYGRRRTDIDYGTNPCSEIILRPYQFCNLSTVIVEPNDDLLSLVDKVKIATTVGTWQSTLTDFQYLRPIWRENTEDERLLGVSMTGQMGHPVLNGSQGKEMLEDWLDTLRFAAVETNKDEAQYLGINASAAVTCVKPEGTTSQLANAASGMHTWHAPYYVRRVRADKKDPLTRLMTDFGVPVEDDMTNPENTAIFSFPIKAPKDALTRKDLRAVQHLDLWLVYQQHWTEHKPSVTVTVKEDEWLETAAWVWKNFDELSGVAFLPYADHVYQQAPYEDLTVDQYYELVSLMPDELPWEELSWYEKYDQTVGSQTLACSANGGCETVDLV